MATRLVTSRHFTKDDHTRLTGLQVHVNEKEKLWISNPAYYCLLNSLVAQSWIDSRDADVFKVYKKHERTMQVGVSRKITTTAH